MLTQNDFSNMSLRGSLFFFAVALIQTISSQCFGTYLESLGSFTPSLSNYNIECLGGYGPSALAASHGPGLTVTSVSPIVPTGVSVISENAYTGPIAVAGEVPFLGVVAVEGRLPTTGLGSVTYACGRGNVAILSESIGRVLPEPLAYVSDGLGYSAILVDLLNNAGISGCGCGTLVY